MTGPDGRRSLRAAVLAAWAAFLAWLWVSGDAYRYLGPRTLWVIPFGTVALIGAAAVHISALRRREPAARRVTGGEMLGALTLLVPIVVVLAVPGAELGASAAARKAPAGLAGALAVGADAPRVAPGHVSFREIHFAGLSDDYAASIGVGHGMDVALIGFVSHPSGMPDEYFALTRFYVSCCAADAIPYSVRVPIEHVGRDYPDDTWLEMRGRIFRGDEGFELYPDETLRVSPPTNPYLY